MNEHDVLAARELVKLEKQYRQMQNDAEASSRQDKVILQKQKKIIQLLEKEKNELEEALQLSESKTVAKSRAKVTREIQQLLEMDFELTKKIETETRDLKEMQLKLQQVSKDKLLEAQKRQREGAETYEDFKKLEVIEENLEAQVHVENERLGKILTENKKLRQEIDDFLQERSIFDKIFQKISKELDTGKKIVFDLIEQGTQAYDERQETIVKLSALKAKAKQDFARSSADVQEVQRATHHMIQLNEFIGKKGQRRIAQETEAKKALQKEETTQAMVNHLTKYRQVVEEIKDKFQEKDLDHLVMQFLKLEEDNYNVYTFNNEQNMRLDQMRKEVEEQEAKILGQQEFNVKQGEIITAKLTELEDLNHTKTEEVEKMKRDLEKSKKVIGKLLKGISEIFHGISCETDSIEKMLGNNKIVNHHNFLLYLQSIERRSQDIAIFSRYQVERTTPRKSEGNSLRRQSIRRSGRVRSGYDLQDSPRSISHKGSRDSKSTILKEEEIPPKTPCPLCAEKLEISEVDESTAVPVDIESLRKEIQHGQQDDGWDGIIHDVAECKLPESRRIMQRNIV